MVSTDSTRAAEGVAAMSSGSRKPFAERPNRCSVAADDRLERRRREVQGDEHGLRGRRDPNDDEEEAEDDRGERGAEGGSGFRTRFTWLREDSREPRTRSAAQVRYGSTRTGRN